MKRTDKNRSRSFLTIYSIIIVAVLMGVIGTIVYKRNFQINDTKTKVNSYNHKVKSKKLAELDKLFKVGSIAEFGDNIRLQKNENQHYKIQYSKELASSWDPEEVADWEDCTVDDNMHKKIRVFSDNKIIPVKTFAEISVSTYKMYLFKNNSGVFSIAFPNTRANLPEDDSDVMLVEEQDQISSNATKKDSESTSVNGVYPPNHTHTILIIATNQQATQWLNNKENSYKYKATNYRNSENSSDLISEHSEKLPNSRTSYGTLTSVYFWVTPDTAEYLGKQRENGTIIFYKATEDFINQNN